MKMQKHVTKTFTIKLLDEFNIILKFWGKKKKTVENKTHTSCHTFQFSIYNKSWKRRIIFLPIHNLLFRSFALNTLQKFVAQSLCSEGLFSSFTRWNTFLSLIWSHSKPFQPAAEGTPAALQIWSLQCKKLRLIS